MNYHAIMNDECGREFLAEIEADGLYDAYDLLAYQYPESRVEGIYNSDDIAKLHKIQNLKAAKDA